METKYVRVPFEVELAKKITNGEVEGRVVTRDGRCARVVCWDKKSDSIYNIVGLIDINTMERILTYTIKGSEVSGEERNNDLMLEIPEYMTFKDGDILYERTNEFWYVFIYNGNGNDKTYCYAALDEEDILWIEDNRITSNDDISELRFATEPEKQKLIEALKKSKNPKAKEYLKRFFNIEIKPECKFKPYDKVLVRSFNQSPWIARFFDRMFEGDYACTDSLTYKNCILYEGNEHLHDTTEDYKEG